MLGAWFGGVLAQNRMKAGWNVNTTRKLTITLGCLTMLPALLAMANPGAPLIAVLIMAVILFGFQTAIGNVQTLPSDLFSGKTVGTLTGFSGMAAKLGAVGLTSLVPWLTAGRQLYACLCHRSFFGHHCHVVCLDSYSNSRATEAQALMLG